MTTDAYWARSLAAFGVGDKLNTITFRSQGVERRWTGRILRIDDKAGLIVEGNDGPRRLCKWEGLISISDVRSNDRDKMS